MKKIVYFVSCILLCIGLLVSWFVTNGTLKGAISHLFDELNPENSQLSLYRPVEWTEDQRKEIQKFYNESTDEMDKSSIAVYRDYFNAVFNEFSYYSISTLAFWLMMGSIRLIAKIISGDNDDDSPILNALIGTPLTFLVNLAAIKFVKPFAQSVYMYIGFGLSSIKRIILLSNSFIIMAIDAIYSPLIILLIGIAILFLERDVAHISIYMFMRNRFAPALSPAKSIIFLVLTSLMVSITMEVDTQIIEDNDNMSFGGFIVGSALFDCIIAFILCRILS